MSNESLKLQAYKKLKHKIIQCEYAPGLPLNEEIIKHDLEMSRTPIKDALSRLESEGLVIIRPKRGLTVAPLTINELNMIFEMRDILECHALKNYGELIETNKLMEFYKLFKSDSISDDAINYDYDDCFHSMIMSTVPNLYVSSSYQKITDQNTRFRVLTGNLSQSRLTQTNAEHLDIIKACLKHDWAQASHYMHLHLKYSKAAALDLLLETSDFL